MNKEDCNEANLITEKTIRNPYALKEVVFDITDESEIQTELEAEVSPARCAGVGECTANAVPRMDNICPPVTASNAVSTLVIPGFTYKNAADIEFLRSFTVTLALDPGSIPEVSLHRIQLCDTQNEPPQELAAVRALTVVAAAEKKIPLSVSTDDAVVKYTRLLS